MCCDGWDNGEPVGECPECGAEVDESGDSVSGCNYSEVVCPLCGDAPCCDAC